MSHIDKMTKAKRISDLELYELVVAMYPEKFGAREEAGDDLWDEVMEFVEDELVGELLCDEQGLRELLGRVLLLTHPIRSGLSGKLYHALGTVSIKGDQVQMMAHAKSEVAVEEFKPSEPTERSTATNAGIEWAVARCEHQKAQGFEETRLDVLIRDFEGCLSTQNDYAARVEPGLQRAITICKELQAEGFSHSKHDALIQLFARERVADAA